MVALGIHVISQGVHLAKEVPTTPAKDFNISATLPMFFPMLAYLTEQTQRGLAMPKTVEFKVVATTSVFPFRWHAPAHIQTLWLHICVMRSQ